MIRRRRRHDDVPDDDDPKTDPADLQGVVEAREELRRLAFAFPVSAGPEADLIVLAKRFGARDDVEIPVTKIRYSGPAEGGSPKKVVEEEFVSPFPAEVVRLFSRCCTRAERAGERGEVVATFETWTLGELREYLEAKL